VKSKQKGKKFKRKGPAEGAVGVIKFDFCNRLVAREVGGTQNLYIYNVLKM
tara:strand:- start:217 stop:369 length:153 start_codon:yes stop_codon:yes gene_type:complete